MYLPAQVGPGLAVIRFEASMLQTGDRDFVRTVTVTPGSGSPLRTGKPPAQLERQCRLGVHYR